MADRHHCPGCESDDYVGTIHDNYYYCDNPDCRVESYDPTNGKRVTLYSMKGLAIGFCPRCQKNARNKFSGGPQGACFREHFKCQHCEWSWVDTRLDPTRKGVDFYE